MRTLAIHGGAPLRQTPFPGWTVTTDADRQGLRRTYEAADWSPDGPQNRAFCKAFADFAGVKHCLTVANGTVSIELILRGLGIGYGDEVIVPPYTFIASISSLIYAGVTPVFADIDPRTYQLSPQAAEKVITPRTKAIMPVYVGGCPADLDAFTALCDRYGLVLIGDAAQAVGARYNGRGVAQYGIASSVSCQNSKNLTCGEGGVILTDDDTLAARITAMLHGGVDADGRRTALGLQNGMSEFQASVLLTQLQALPAQIARRSENGAYLDRRLRELDFVYPMIHSDKITCNAYHLYMFGLREERLGGVTRDEFLAAVNAEGVPVSTGYVPAYTFPCLHSAYTRQCIGGSIDPHPDTPAVEQVAYHEDCWLYHSLLLGTRQDMDDIVNALIKVYEGRDQIRKGV